MLPQKECERVETYTYRFPIDQPPNAMPLTFDYSEDERDMNIRPIINRRDWAYALEGFRNTFMGGVYEGSASMVDLGFWCFLQAALLKMEPDHLANVGFHLNNRGAFDDAASVLCYARSLHVDHPGIHNNLAHTLASLGNFHEALAEQSNAIALSPTMSRYRDKMRTYGNLAGLSLNPEASVLRMSTPSIAFAEAQSAIGQEMATFTGQRLFTLMRKATQDLFNLRRVCDQKVGTSETESIKCHSKCGDARNTVCHCNCEIKRWQTSWNALMEFFFELAPRIDAYERSCRKELIASKDRMITILEEHRRGMRPDEIRAAYEGIYNWYLGYQFGEGMRLHLEGILMSARQNHEMLKATLEECGRSIRDAMSPIDPADTFGRRPRTIVLKELNPESNKTWHIWFGVGSLDLHPDDTATLSLGIKGVLSGKLMYNFRTHDFGSGIAVGLNLGKAFGPIGETLFKNTMKFEFFAEVDSAKGPRAGIDTGINPRVGVLHTDQKLVIRLEN
jgi:hypothetical protein